MAEKLIIRGDSYTSLRPLYTYTFVNDEGGPMNFTGCSIRTTYKEATTDPNVDTTDTSAAIKHDLVIDESGAVIVSNGLTLVAGVAGGIIQEVLTRTETLALPLGVTLKSDLELTTPDEVVTFISDDTVKAIDAYTNRAS